ncbi:TonB-dependent receptor [plant metagenome]|uniref:TonB-dependent receptor n=1 Tax=plant metagenome TaxID=1297885 RepID=A0A484TMB8_9ZZZZ
MQSATRAHPLFQGLRYMKKHKHTPKSPLAVGLAIALIQSGAWANATSLDIDKDGPIAPPATSSNTSEPPRIPTNSMTTLDQVKVVGSSVQTNPIDEERYASGVVDILKVGDVSVSSQTNVADLAKRLPGISVSFDQGRNQTATGESQYITIRGFDTSYNAYTLDGLRLPQTQSSRAIPVNLLSPFAVAEIFADKTPGADKDSDAIAGVIDFRTPSGFDHGPMTRIRATNQISGTAKRRDQDAFGGAVGIDDSRLFGADRQFGLYTAAYYERRDSVAESTAIHSNWYSTYNNGLNARQNENSLSPRGLLYNFFRSEIQRYGVSTSLDYRGNNFAAFGRFNYASYSNNNTMDQLTIRSEAGNYNNSIDGQYKAYQANPSQYFRTEDVRQKLLSSTIGGEWKTDNVNLSLTGGYAKGRFDQPERITGSFRNTRETTGPDALDLDTSNERKPVLTTSSGNALQDIPDPEELYVARDYSRLSETKKTLKAHLDWNGSSALSHIGAGLLYEDSERNGENTDNVATEQKRYTFTPGMGYEGVASAPGTYLKGFFSQLPRDLKLLNRAAMTSRAYQYIPTLAVGEDGVTNGREKRAAAYVNTRISLSGDYGDVDITPGLRYEHNHFRASFWISDGDNSSFDTADSEFSRLNPSVLAAWRPNAKTVVRAAVRSSYSRPAFDQLAGTTSITRDGTDNEITAINQANPDLRPVEAWSYDLGLEYYSSNNRFFQIALYHKDLQNIIVPTTSYSGYEGTASVNDIAISKPENGLTGKATGLEASGRFALNLGEGWLSGFGIGANATWQTTIARYLVTVNSTTELRRTEIPEAPKLIYNAEIFYEHEKWRGNLWYNYIGRRLTTVQTDRPDVYIQPSKELNLGLTYSLANNTELGFSVRNLLNGHSYWTTLGKSKRYLSVDRSGGYLETGRVFQLSLTTKF